MRTSRTMGLTVAMGAAVLVLGTAAAVAAQPGPGAGQGRGPVTGMGTGMMNPGGTQNAPFGPMGQNPMGQNPMGGMGMGAGMGMGMGMGTMGGVGMMGGVDVGAHFIQEMIPHHEDAVVMADLALTQATRPEIVELARTIKQTQTAEIDQMRDWYAAWYGGEVPASMMQQMQMPMAMHGTMAGQDPVVLDGATPFDKAFIEQMIPHHQVAVMMSSHMLNGVTRPELRDLLTSITETQTAEIQQMQQWYTAWYGTDSSATPHGQRP